MKKETKEEHDIRCKRDYGYTAERLIKRLQTLPPTTRVLCSSDEEGNSIMWGIEVAMYDETSVCFYPLSTLEVDTSLINCDKCHLEIEIDNSIENINGEITCESCETKRTLLN